jgi:hypothetical protein
MWKKEEKEIYHISISRCGESTGKVKGIVNVNVITERSIYGSLTPSHNNMKSTPRQI